MTTKTLKFKPYARLLTMLGDQLIRNEQVALSELIKNAYDADASWVKIVFQGYDEAFVAGPGARIVVEDDGHGMTTTVIEDHWVNPATPMKLMGKQGERRRTAGGRIIQGEKGIGRFALLKLGRDIRMVTRPAGGAAENVLDLRLAKYDEDFISEGKALFLDDVEMQLATVSPAATIVEGDIDVGGRTRRRRPQGTHIEISEGSAKWTRGKVEKIYEDLSRLRSNSRPADDVRDGSEGDPEGDTGFEVSIYRDGIHEAFGGEQRERLNTLLRDNVVFTVAGRYDERREAFDFEIDGREQILELTDPEITGLPVFREYLKRHGLKPAEADQIKPECGSFGFSFHVFDLSADAKGKLALDKKDKDLIKKHRIYLYRDGIRVYPYGDADDDWLMIDVRRGTVRASEFMSNDQVVGFVEISQAGNASLRDKTSREGLVDTGRAVDDFTSLLQTFLAWVRKGPYAGYQFRTRQSDDVTAFKDGKVRSAMDEAISAASAEGVPASVRDKVMAADRQYRAERRYLVRRAEDTEHLAGVGLSVEAASHDLMMAMQRVLSSIDRLAAACDRPGAIDKDALREELVSMRGLLSFVQSQMSDMQALFRSTKQRRKDIRVIELVEKVAKIFKGPLERASITVELETVGAPLVAKTTDAVLLQLLLNLFDNAVYWLQGARPPREIAIQLDGDAGVMVFADNGPGFREDDVPYVFEPFFSGKGEDGRGLGLYIARQLLERHEYAIEVAPIDRRILSGANLMVSFVKGQS